MSRARWRELRHVLEVEKRANGVIVMTSYGDKLIGDESFKPIWEMLNKHSALVFVDPGHVNITPAKISGFLPQPVIDYPQATTRAAMSLLLSGIMTDFTSIEVILSHAGGTFPYLGQRAIGSLVDPMTAQNSKVNVLVDADNVVARKLAASRFWYDIALSTSEPQLKALLGIYGGLLQYSKCIGSDEGKKIAPAQLNENATGLLRKHRGEKSFLPHAEGGEYPKEPEFGLEDSKDAEAARAQLDNF
ncbi:hypothetical protein SCUP234_05488 [Seiridium cupressi]